MRLTCHHLPLYRIGSSHHEGMISSLHAIKIIRERHHSIGKTYMIDRIPQDSRIEHLHS